MTTDRVLGGRDVCLGRLVAVKVLNGDLAQDPLIRYQVRGESADARSDVYSAGRGGSVREILGNGAPPPPGGVDARQGEAGGPARRRPSRWASAAHRGQ